MPDYLTAKLASIIGGLLGGGAILTFIKPKTIGEAFIRGGCVYCSSSNHNVNNYCRKRYSIQKEKKTGGKL